MELCSKDFNQKKEISHMTTSNKSLEAWVSEVAMLTKPDKIHWCDGSDSEKSFLIDLMVKSGTLIALNQESHPGCYLHRSDPSDVARSEHLTFVCTTDVADAGPNNNWLAPKDGHKKVDPLFAGCMKGRTMYVIPYCMGPIDSPLARCGVEITDSAYVVANMRIMTRMGAAALKRIEREGSFVKGLHSTGDLSPERRLVMHFPEELMIKSIGSGYGGNALLGKKCHALRLGSFQAKTEGWLAEHMLIVGIENPKGERHYIAAAFPSACGKTNLAMLIPPEAYREKGWKVFTVGDDIAWIHPGKDGRLYAINPEAGYFGVAPGTGPNTNPTALNMLSKDAIFTNVGLTSDKKPWWEGLTKHPPEGLTDWQGRPWDSSTGPAAQANSRFTVSAKQCGSYTPAAEEPQGVPLSAIVFGGRRKELAPLVVESLSWKHGVFLGASVASETTAAATGALGVVRRDPMAMQPFCGYNFGDYWTHWLSMEKHAKLPKIFHVNWFRQDKDGKYMWPGFGDNMRVLEWILERCQGRGDAVRTPIGYMPTSESINTLGTGVSPSSMRELLSIEPAAWRNELEGINAYFATYGDRMPKDLLAEAKRIAQELNG
ncbi:MAG: phosphoenolpyruvate carboxykinase (GTP) [Proteobacteria bacterium]|nr:phosphoenolpyruvate carboxykinase (GTP) [Pseudomonadota bacterium]